MSVFALSLIVLAGCTQAPQRQANGRHFGTCSVPVVGDVAVDGAHGIRFAFNEASDSVADRTRKPPCTG